MTARSCATLFLMCGLAATLLAAAGCRQAPTTPPTTRPEGARGDEDLRDIGIDLPGFKYTGVIRPSQQYFGHYKDGDVDRDIMVKFDRGRVYLNDVDYGPVKSGDRIRVNTGGKLFVNNALRSADPSESKPASSSGPSKVAVYDADPGHLWNRLYAALYVRTTDDGQSYGQDGLDPYLWPSSTYLLTEPRHGQILALLNEFLDKRGDNLIAQPLKRAFFQNDLWAIFDWLADPDAEYVEKRARFIAERRALRNRLAPIIRRLALSVEQIEALPDNYRAALASEAYPPKQDPAHTERAFLPRDLFDGHGPWVHFQNGEGKPHPFSKPTALTHVHFAGGRSTFFVFMNLPGGRQATLDYLQKVNAFPPASGPQGRLLTSNAGALPPPSGTQLAIVRQMMLVDDKGKMRPTRLIESVQIRVVRGNVEKESDFYEFTQHRKELFDGKGLRAVKSDEVTIPVFNVRDEDVLDLPGSVRRLREAAVRGEGRATENLRIGCTSCHTQSGIASVSSFFHDRSPGLTAAERGPEVERVIRWKGEKFGWGLLQGLATEPRH